MRKTEQQANGRLLPFVPEFAVVTSSELIHSLRNKGYSDENARQLIRRHSKSKEIWRSENLKLARGERLFARSGFLGSGKFFTAVASKLGQTSRHGLARLLTVLGRVHVLNRIEVVRLLAVALEGTATFGPRTRPVYDDELRAIGELGVQVIHKGTQLESIVSPTMSVGDDADAIAAIAAERVRNEAVLARVVLNHLRRQNMLAWNRLQVPDLEVPFVVFNQQVFSGYGFSYLSPFARWKEGDQKPTPCPVLLDCYHETAILPHVQSFAQRIERATNRGKSHLNVLGVIAARDFDKDAWNDARRRGLLAINLRQVFGAEALDAMVIVERLFHGSSSPEAGGDVESFEEFADLLRDLKTNPIVVSLRSIGFEALSGLVLRSRGYEQVEMGRIVPWNETFRDVDVFGIRDGELLVVECKAYHRRKSIPGGEVSKFFTETLPALKKWLRVREIKFSNCTAEIWTTGPLGNIARDELFQLRRPKSDEWNLVPLRQLEQCLPDGIRKRSIELLRSIAMTPASDTDDFPE